MAPVLAGGIVAGTIWAAVPHDAWLPVPRAALVADAWRWPLEPATAWLADLHVRIASTIARRDVVTGALALTTAAAAVTTGVLALVLRTTGLGALGAALLAVVAAAAPLLSWQAGSPFGGALLSLAAALLLWWMTRSVRPPRLDQAALTVGPARPAIGLAVVAIALVITWFAGGTGEALARLRHDLGAPGVVLLLVSLAGVTERSPSGRRVWLAATALWVVTVPLPSHLRAAALLPLAWWLVGLGLTRVQEWRGHRARRWIIVGLVAWTALHVARVPWGQQRQQVALVRAWAEGVAGGASHVRPVVADDTAHGRLIDALLRMREGVTREDLVVAIGSARDAVDERRPPVVVDETSREVLRWSGVALDDMDDPGGVPIERLLDALPRGTIVLAALSRQAAATLAPAQWQALGRVGLRFADAGVARAHVVAGVTRARVEALESVHAGSVSLDLQPGDPLGRTGARSPVDARLEADAERVRVLLRDRPFLDEAGLAIVIFTTRGDLLGWRSGPDASHLDGPPLGGGPRVRSQAVAALPCIDVPASQPTRLDDLAGVGTLGLTAARAPLTVAFTADGAGRPSFDPRLITTAQDARGARLDRVPTEPGVRLTIVDTVPIGMSVPPGGTLTARGSEPFRACAAWPLTRTFSLEHGPIDLALLPRVEALHISGWHALEARSGGGYFRWMDGPRATLLLPVRTARDVRIVLDAQGVRTPEPGDVARLSVNGQSLGQRPLHPTRGLYAWDVPARLLRPGVNVLGLETTATIRPADRTPGGDPRRLGLLVYGWRLEPTGRTDSR